MVMSVSQSVVDEEASVVVGGRTTETEGEDIFPEVEVWLDEESEDVDRPGVEVTVDKVLEGEVTSGVRTIVSESDGVETPGVLMDEPSVIVVSQGSVVV